MSQLMADEVDGKGSAEAKSEAQGRKGDDLVVQDAVITDGRIWVDLPFMVQDIQNAWKNVMILSTSFEHRCNLAAAIGRLAGLGIRDEAFNGCGLDIMRQALEMPRSADPRLSVDDQVESDHAVTAEAPLTVLQLFLVVQILLHYWGINFSNSASPIIHAANLVGIPVLLHLDSQLVTLESIPQALVKRGFSSGRRDY